MHTYVRTQLNVIAMHTAQWLLIASADIRADLNGFTESYAQLMWVQVKRYQIFTTLLRLHCGQYCLTFPCPTKLKGKWIKNGCHLIANDVKRNKQMIWLKINENYTHPNTNIAERGKREVEGETAHFIQLHSIRNSYNNFRILFIKQTLFVRWFHIFDVILLDINSMGVCCTNCTTHTYIHVLTFKLCSKFRFNYAIQHFVPLRWGISLN